MKWFLAANSKLNESVPMPLDVALKNGANQSNALNTFLKTAQKVQSVKNVNSVKSKFSDTTLTIPKNVAQFELANAPLNLVHFTTETQSATNTKLFINLEILAAVARLACARESQPVLGLETGEESVKEDVLPGQLGQQRLAPDLLKQLGICRYWKSLLVAA